MPVATTKLREYLTVEEQRDLDLLEAQIEPLKESRHRILMRAHQRMRGGRRDPRDRTGGLHRGPDGGNKRRQQRAARGRELLGGNRS